MYEVSKTFTFCYGHRLLKDPGKCARFHGHSAEVTISLAAKDLDEAGMVCHFTVLKERIGGWIESKLDHRMILCKDDPLCTILKEAGEEFVEIEVNPTAENLAKMIFELAREEGLPVTQVELWESPTSKATYTV